MRTVPSKFSTDAVAGKDLFYLFSLTTDSTTYHWHTSSESFNLWPNTAASPGGSALTKDATQVAYEVNGEKIPIAVLQGAVTILNGGGVSAAGATTITLLNQDRYEGTLLAEELYNRTVVIRKGYVNTTTGVGLNDMVVMKTLIVEDYSYDYQTLVLDCVDGAMVRHRVIPNIVIEEDDFPNAPKDSIGQRVPILYGDFETNNTAAIYTYSGTNLYRRHFGVYDVAPTITLDEKGNVFAVSELGLDSVTGGVYHRPSDAVGGLMASYTMSATPTASGFVSADFAYDAEGTYFCVPKREGTEYAVADWVNVVDDDPDTYAVGTNVFGQLNFNGVEGRLIEVSGGGAGESIRLWAVYEVTAGTNNDTITLTLYYPENPAGQQFSTATTITVGVGGTISKRIVSDQVALGIGAEMSILSGAEMGLRTTNDPAPTVRVYHLVAEIQTKFRPQVMSRRGRR